MNEYRVGSEEFERMANECDRNIARAGTQASRDKYARLGRMFRARSRKANKSPLGFIYFKFPSHKIAREFGYSG